MKKATRLGMLACMDRYLQWPTMLAVTLLLAACGTIRSSVVVEPTADSGYTSLAVNSYPVPSRTPIPGGSYAVVKGDTLYSIAFRKGVDFRDLAQWNGIAQPYTIWPGQRLTLSPPAKALATHAAAPSPAGRVANAPVFEPVVSPPVTVAGGPPAHPATAPVKSAAPAIAATAAVVVPVAGIPAVTRASVPPPAPAASGVSRVVSGVHWRWPAGGSLVSRFKSGDAIPGIEIAGKSGDPVRAAADGVVVYSGNGLVGYGELVIIKHSDSFLSAYGHNRKRLVKEGQRVTGGQQIAEMGSTGVTRNELEFQIRKDGNPVDPLSYLPPR
jgi:lipoprotein NlpD